MTSHNDPLQRVAAALRAAEAAQHTNAFIFLPKAAEVMNMAEQVRTRLAAGESLPLAGWTFAVKDNIDVAGWPTSAAHPEFVRVAERSAPAVDALVSAGAVPIGKTNLDQFATGLVGTRSPFGVVRSSVDSTRVSGGSSSGSAAAVGHGIVDFALGTDTAGSGRVPAVFNNVVGLKPSLGTVSTAGVVPACPSYDTISVLAPDIDAATAVFDVLSRTGGRRSGTWTDVDAQSTTALSLAVPNRDDLSALSAEAAEAFEHVVHRMMERGHTVRRVDLSVFLEAGRLLYDGGLVAERAWSFGEFLLAHPTGADPSVSSVAQRATTISGTEVVAAQQRLRRLREEAVALLQGCHALLTPTAPAHPTVEEVEADPLGLNSVLGTYTNFVNLFDLSAVAVPVARIAEQGMVGVTVVAPAGKDHLAAGLAQQILRRDRTPGPGEQVELAVFGAHCRDMPLNDDLLARGGRFVEEIATSPDHRMFLIPGPVSRPVVQGGHELDGTALHGELWRLPVAELGPFLTTVTAPMSIGPVTLHDGRNVLGFTGRVPTEATDITEHGSWRQYRAALARATS